MSIESTLEYIHSVSWLGSKPGLSRTKELLNKLGNPHNSLKFIHVAGTNGKGSVCSFLSSILTLSGFKTGLYTSPYINCFNERIRINGNNISDADLEHYTDIIRPYAEEMSEHPTEFEMISALAMLYFADKGCDIVVLEVGLGGELDSTNVIPTPECAVITPIGLDHTAQLGNTIAEIAMAKAGIIKGGEVVYCSTAGDDAERVIADICRNTGSSLTMPDLSKITNLTCNIHGSTFDYKDYKAINIGLVGTYQPINAVTALTVIEILIKKGYNIPRSCIYKGLHEARWSGRFEVLGEHPVFIIDGAHNPHGMTAALNSLCTLFPNKKITFITGAMADKDIMGMYSLIIPIAKEFYTVTPNNIRAMSNTDLAQIINALGGISHPCDSFDNAVTTALKTAGNDGIVVALGSLYFSNDIRTAYYKVVKKSSE